MKGLREIQKLTWPERSAAAAVAVTAGVCAVVLLVCPPQATEPAPSCCAEGSEVVTVDADTELLELVLVAIAGSFLLISVLGVRFTRIDAGKVRLETATVTSVGDGEHREEAAQFIPRNQLEEEWEKLPAWAMDALREWADGYGLTRALRYSIVRAEKEERRWSRAWSVKVLTDDDSVIDLRLTFGRGLSNVREESEPG